MKKILIIHSNMELGGAETSLLGLLQNIDYSQYEVDLLLFEQKGELLPLIPETVMLKPVVKECRCMVLPIKEVLLKEHLPGITLARLMGKFRGKNRKDKTYATKQYAHYYAMRFLPMIEGRYDMAISFIDPHFYLEEKVDAKIKLGWIHTDFSRVFPDPKLDRKMWNELDYIVHVSESCKEKFDLHYPDMNQKSIVVENMLSKPFVYQRASAVDAEREMPKGDFIRLLSVGRYTQAKNFDNVPYICEKLVGLGLNIKWYIIGYGSDEELIKQNIRDAHMEERVVLLGKKTNPYPYISVCDLYVQPSRFEGKCVTVREAQMLGKPVVITKYATSSSQLEDGVDGVIVPMDNEGCAQGIAAVLQDPGLQAKLIENCKHRDYSNAQEVEKLYQLMGDS